MSTHNMMDILHITGDSMSSTRTTMSCSRRGQIAAMHFVCKSGRKLKTNRCIFFTVGKSQTKWNKILNSFSTKRNDLFSGRWHIQHTTYTSSLFKIEFKLHFMQCNHQAVASSKTQLFLTLQLATLVRVCLCRKRASDSGWGSAEKPLNCP